MIGEPEEVFQNREKYSTILISVEVYGEIAKMLEEKGYVYQKDYFVIKNTLYEKYRDEFYRKCDIEYLIMGDCEFSKVSLDDRDMTDLREMLKLEMGEDKTKILAMHGFGPRAHYIILKELIERNEIPRKLLLMVNLDTLNGKQHLLPRTQHEKLFDLIYETGEDFSSEFVEYLKVINDRASSFKTDFFVEQNVLGNGGTQKERVHFLLNYMYRLDTNVEGLLYYRKLVELCSQTGIECTVFIPPVNYQLAENIFGEKFFNIYDANIKKIRDLFSEDQVRWIDLSYLLECSEFAAPNTSDEIANYAGRIKIVRILSERLREGM